MEKTRVSNPITINNQESKTLMLYPNIIGINKRHQHCRFSNYSVNPDNKKQFEVCRTWNGKDSITLTGKTGTGKTHLAIAMLRNFHMIELDSLQAQKQREKLESYLDYPEPIEQTQRERFQKSLETGLYKYRRANCAIISVVEMFIKINDAAISSEGKINLLNKYAIQYDCICLDDLGAEKLTDAKRENLYYIIDARYRNMLPTIITTNFTINEINNFEPRIASRLSEMGNILQFDGNDYRLNRC